MTPIRSSVLFSLVAVALCSSCGPEEGSGFVVTTEHFLGGKQFSKVHVEDRLSVNIVRGQQKVTVTTDENLIDRFVADVDGDTLKLRLKRNDNVDATYAHVEVSSELLRELEVRDGSQVTAEATQAEEWHLGVSGGSTCVLNNMLAERLFLNVTDKSQVDVTGRAGTVNLDVHDKSRANTDGVTAARAKVDASDQSTVNVRASDEIEIDSSGDSKIFITGNPAARDINTDKGSQIIFVTGQ